MLKSGGSENLVISVAKQDKFEFFAGRFTRRWRFAVDS